MGLKCGIVGLTKVGKTTIFNCLSNTKAEADKYSFSAAKSNIGQVSVPDYRLKVLTELQPTAKVVHTTVEIVDIPGLSKGSNKTETGGAKFLADIRNTNAIVHVLRCFEDENLPHIEGSIDPVRDIEIIDLELQAKDLESIEKKISRMQKALKAGDKDVKKTLEVLEVYKDHFQNFQNARTIEISEDDKKQVSDLSLLTAKPIMYVCNVDDKSAINGNKYVDQVKNALKDTDVQILVIAGMMEAEIATLENEEDRTAFLTDAGLAEPGVNKLIRAAYSMLDLITFFTIGPEENRAWTITKGMTAPQAAGEIHSDLERGFIRAEVMKYNDFITLKTEHACKTAGKLYIEGKSYVVDDGDILHIRFNV